jgi:hypothetical protein
MILLYYLENVNFQHKCWKCILIEGVPVFDYNVF